jgi:hypothetical protein
MTRVGALVNGDSVVAVGDRVVGVDGETVDG